MNTRGVIFNIQKFSLHDGPGIRSTVFFKGCNLKCAWCANPESQRMHPQPALNVERCTLCGACIRACPNAARSVAGDRIRVAPDLCAGCGACRDACVQDAATMEGRIASVQEIVDEVCKDKPFYDRSGGGVTFSGGEPLMQLNFALALAEALRARGIRVAAETAAAVPPESFESLLRALDYVFVDFKHHDSARHRAGTGVGNEFVLENIRRAAESGKPFTVRIPVIPGYNDGLDDAGAFAAALLKLGVRRVQLLPFHQLGERKYSLLGREYAYSGRSQLHREDLETYRAAFEARGVRAEF